MISTSQYKSEYKSNSFLFVSNLDGILKDICVNIRLYDFAHDGNLHDVTYVCPRVCLSITKRASERERIKENWLAQCASNDRNAMSKE